MILKHLLKRRTNQASGNKQKSDKKIRSQLTYSKIQGVSFKDKPEFSYITIAIMKT